MQSFPPLSLLLCRRLCRRLLWNIGKVNGPSVRPLLLVSFSALVDICRRGMREFAHVNLLWHFSVFVYCAFKVIVFSQPGMHVSKMNKVPFCEVAARPRSMR